MAKTLILASEKGGNGRTTWVKTLGAVLARLGWRCVVVDTDTQGSLSFEMGVAVDVADGDLVLYDFVNRRKPFSEVLKLIPPDFYGGDSTGELWLLPSNEETMYVAALNTDSTLFRSRLLQIEQAKDADGNPRFDLILVDTSPSPGMIHPPIYKAGHGVLLVAKPESSPVNQLYATIKHLENAHVERLNEGIQGIQVLGILPNLIDRRWSIHELYIRRLEEDFPGQVWEPIPAHVAWAEASHMKKCVTASHPGTEAANLAERIAKRVEGWLHE